MHDIPPIGGACVWHGSAMARSARWRRQLSPPQLTEIVAALAAARARGLSWEGIEAADFPLPSFAALAEDIRAELENGSGIVLLRGIEPGRYSPDEQKLLYAGLCRQIGTLVYSNRAGEIMREIRDVTRAMPHPAAAMSASAMARCRKPASPAPFFLPMPAL